MEKLESFLEYYYVEKGYNCAETILYAANAAWHLNLPENSISLVSGFGAGMGCAIICGAVSGGVSALSYKFSNENGYDKQFLMNNVRYFIKKVREDFDDENCKSLHQKFFTKDEHCLPTIKKIALILDDVCNKMLTEQNSNI